jgi:hypothetical protein
MAGGVPFETGNADELDQVQVFLTDPAEAGTERSFTTAR